MSISSEIIILLESIFGEDIIDQNTTRKKVPLPTKSKNKSVLKITEKIEKKFWIENININDINIKLLAPVAKARKKTECPGKHCYWNILCEFLFHFIELILT